MHNGNSNLRKLAMQAKKRLNGAFIEKQSCPKKDLNTATIYRNLYKNNFKIINEILINGKNQELHKYYLLSVSMEAQHCNKSLL